MSGAGFIPNEEAYAYAMGRIRTLETRLFDRTRYDRLLEAESPQAALKQLTDAGYGLDDDEPTLADIDRMIARDTSQTYHLMRSISPDPNPIDMIAVRFDLDDVKRSIRGSKGEHTWRMGPVANAATDPATPGVYSPPLMRFFAAIDTARGEKLPPSRSDAAVDRAGYELIQHYARQTASGELIELAQQMASAANILTILRSIAIGRNPVEIRQHVVPGGLPTEIITRLTNYRIEEAAQAVRGTPFELAVARGISAFIEQQKLDVLERELDNVIIAGARVGRRTAMGPEVITGYLLAKEFEYKNLRLILFGLQSQLSPEQIKQRLRDAYV